MPLNFLFREFSEVDG